LFFVFLMMAFWWQDGTFHLFSFLAALGFELKTCTLSQSTSPFLWWVFWDRVLWTICLGWPQIAILQLSASWVARITGVSHQCPAVRWNLKCSFDLHFL
jgi:hypothetical protein